MAGKDSAVIVVHYGERELLEGCVKGLVEAGVVPADVVIVDNGPEIAGAGSVPEGVAWLRPSENRGFAGGANLGLAHAVSAGYEFAMLLNADATIEVDTIERMSQCMRADDAIGICGPAINEGNGAGLIAGARIDWRRGVVEDLHAEGGAVWDVDYVPGCGMLVRLSAVESVGMFDEQFFLYWEDADLCVRATRRGWRVVVCGDVELRHARSQTTGRHRRLVPYYMTRNGLYFFQKHSRGSMAKLGMVVRLVARGFGIGIRCVVGGRIDEGWGRLGGVADYCRGRLGRSARYSGEGTFRDKIM